MGAPHKAALLVLSALADQDEEKKHFKSNGTASVRVCAESAFCALVRCAHSSPSVSVLLMYLVWCDLETTHIRPKSREGAGIGGESSAGLS